MSRFPLAKVKSKANGLGRNMYANPPDVQVLGSLVEVAAGLVERPNGNNASFGNGKKNHGRCVKFSSI